MSRSTSVQAPWTPERSGVGHGSQGGLEVGTVFDERLATALDYEFISFGD